MTIKKNTLIGRACEKVPGFHQFFQTMMTQIKLNGQSQSTLQNYGKCLAKMSLHFGCIPLDLSDAQINDYLLMLNDTQAPSLSYFKHTVYGLRYAFRLHGREDRAIRLPTIKRLKTLPVVLSRAECRRLFNTPKLLKHRLLLSIIYSAGLRLQELRFLQICDLDFDRMQIHIKNGKGGKHRYVPLSKHIARGLKTYFFACAPKKWVFNGQNGEQMSNRGIQFIMREAVKKAGIKKKATLHTLRHSYATHLLEDGLDITTIQKLLGHATIQTTMEYLHIAQLPAQNPHSPFDTLYPSNNKANE